MRILVTGANGFVGSALCLRLTALGHSVVAALRAPISGTEPALGGAEVKIIGDIAADPPWHEILPGVEIVIHLAALVHQMGKVTPSPDAYRHVNTAATVQLADACVRHGVRRLIFLSSIKVNGEGTPKEPYAETDTPAPLDAYAISKLEAEQALNQPERGERIEIVVVRPPLIYGPGVRANFRRLMAMVSSMNPVLIPQLRGKRSMIFVGNLVDFLTVCCSHPSAGGQLFLVSDNEDVSVSDLMQRLAHTMKRRALRIPLPEGMLRLAARVLGKEQEMRRLMDPLTIRPAKAMKVLGWRPPFDLNTGLARTVEAWLASKTR